MELEALMIHAIGFVAATIGSLSYLIERPRRILILHALSWGFWGSYFLLLGGTAGLVVAVLSAAICLIGAFGSERLMRRTAFGGLLPIWAVGFYLHGDGLGLVAVWAPILASTIETLSIAVRDRAIGFRAAALGANACWFAFGLAVGAYVSVAFAVISGAVIVMTGVCILRKRREVGLEVNPQVAEPART